jgi:pimeloyl-ACP methyl ester carboxylesterase
VLTAFWVASGGMPGPARSLARGLAELGPDTSQATLVVPPDSGHFPHLAQPRRFAECLKATARWPDAVSTSASRQE